MKFYHLSVLFIVVLSFFGTAQELVYNLDFEDQTAGTEITKGNTLKFQGWKNSIWIIEEEENNKVAKGSDQGKLFFVKQFNVESGATYQWEIDTRSRNNGQGWKRNINLAVVCGTGENSKLATASIEEPQSGKWISSNLKFTVPKDKTKISLQLFRFAEGTEVSIDNYKLVKL